MLKNTIIIAMTMTLILYWLQGSLEPIYTVTIGVVSCMIARMLEKNNKSEDE